MRPSNHHEWIHLPTSTPPQNVDVGNGGRFGASGTGAQGRASELARLEGREGTYIYGCTYIYIYSICVLYRCVYIHIYIYIYIIYWSMGGTWDPIWPFFLGHTPLTEKNGHTEFYGFVSTTCRKNMGFIRVIYANDRKIMAIRANTGKYGSLTEKKQPYGVPGTIYIYIHTQMPSGHEKNKGHLLWFVELKAEPLGNRVYIYIYIYILAPRMAVFFGQTSVVGRILPVWPMFSGHLRKSPV